LTALRYERTGRIARITLDRPERANAITLAMPGELAECVEEANLDPAVHRSRTRKHGRWRSRCRLAAEP
jgi:enoyl-CoA hydratase